MGVLANHVPSIEQLKPGLIEVIEESGGSKQFFLSGGFAIVQPNSQLSINAVEGYPLEDFSADAVRSQINEAQKIASGGGSEQDVAEAKIELEAGVTAGHGKRSEPSFASPAFRVSRDGNEGIRRDNLPPVGVPTHQFCPEGLWGEKGVYYHPKSSAGGLTEGIHTIDKHKRKNLDRQHDTSQTYQSMDQSSSEASRKELQDVRSRLRSIKNFTRSEEDYYERHLRRSERSQSVLDQRENKVGDALGKQSPTKKRSSGLSTIASSNGTSGARSPAGEDSADKVTTSRRSNIRPSHTCQRSREAGQYQSTRTESSTSHKRSMNTATDSLRLREKSNSEEKDRISSEQISDTKSAEHDGKTYGGRLSERSGTFEELNANQVKPRELLENGSSQYSRKFHQYGREDAALQSEHDFRRHVEEELGATHSPFRPYPSLHDDFQENDLPKQFRQQESSPSDASSSQQRRSERRGKGHHRAESYSVPSRHDLDWKNDVVQNENDNKFRAKHEHNLSGDTIVGSGHVDHVRARLQDAARDQIHGKSESDRAGQQPYGRPLKSTDGRMPTPQARPSLSVKSRDFKAEPGVPLSGLFQALERDSHVSHERIGSDDVFENRDAYTKPNISTKGLYSRQLSPSIAHPPTVTENSVPEVSLSRHGSGLSHTTQHSPPPDYKKHVEDSYLANGYVSAASQAQRQHSTTEKERLESSSKTESGTGASRAPSGSASRIWPFKWSLSLNDKSPIAPPQSTVENIHASNKHDEHDFESLTEANRSEENIHHPEEDHRINATEGRKKTLQSNVHKNEANQKSSGPGKVNIKKELPPSKNASEPSQRDLEATRAIRQSTPLNLEKPASNVQQRRAVYEGKDRVHDLPEKQKVVRRGDSVQERANKFHRQSFDREKPSTKQHEMDLGSEKKKVAGTASQSKFPSSSFEQSSEAEVGNYFSSHDLIGKRQPRAENVERSSHDHSDWTQRGEASTTLPSPLLSARTVKDFHDKGDQDGQSKADLKAREATDNAQRQHLPSSSILEDESNARSVNNATKASQWPKSRQECKNVEKRKRFEDYKPEETVKPTHVHQKTRAFEEQARRSRKSDAQREPLHGENLQAAKSITSADSSQVALGVLPKSSGLISPVSDKSTEAKGLSESELASAERNESESATHRRQTAKLSKAKEYHDTMADFSRPESRLARLKQSDRETARLKQHAGELAEIEQHEDELSQNRQSRRNLEDFYSSERENAAALQHTKVYPGADVHPQNVTRPHIDVHQPTTAYSSTNHRPPIGVDIEKIDQQSFAHHADANTAINVNISRAVSRPSTPRTKLSTIDLASKARPSSVQRNVPASSTTASPPTTPLRERAAAAATSVPGVLSSPIQSARETQRNRIQRTQSMRVERDESTERRWDQEGFWTVRVEVRGSSMSPERREARRVAAASGEGLVVVSVGETPIREGETEIEREREGE
ncbi:MAG: hypothetical protein Q9227_007536 [Pyrenula ochraceoflavens]